MAAMKMTFRIKLFIAFFLMAMLLVGLVVTIIYREMRQLPEDVTRGLVTAAVANAAEAIDVDDVLALHEQMLAAMDRAKADEPEKDFVASLAFAELCRGALYRRLHDRMVDVDMSPPHFGKDMGSGEPAERVLTERGYEKDVYIVVPTDRFSIGLILVSILPEDSGRFYDMSNTPEMMRGWQEVSAESQISADEYGRTLGGWAPIRNQQGRTVAILGIDAPAKFIEGISRDMLLITLAIVAFAAAASVVPAAYISWRLNRPMNLLSEGVKKITTGTGDAHVEPIRSRDEFEDLIANFNTMVDGLAERDTLRQSLALAMEIQQNLLPHECPRPEGFDISGGVDYCDETGGDYYDFIEIRHAGPTCLGIAIGDVTGHGIGAALLMASARAVIRSHAIHHTGRLDELFEDINVHMVHDTGETRFMTLFYTVLDCEARTLLYASAGHDPTLWLHARTGEFEELGNTGIPLGILSNAEYTQKGPLKLETGDLLVFSTDGIREARNAQGEMFGTQRLVDTVRRCADDSAEVIRKEIILAARAFQAGHSQDDDITLVIVKCVL